MIEVLLFEENDEDTLEAYAYLPRTARLIAVYYNEGRTA